MSDFPGFPAKTRQTPLPNLFFSAVLPEIDDLIELKVTLWLFWKLSWKKGYPRFVTLGELAGDLEVVGGLGKGGGDPAARLAHGLRLAVSRGTFLHLALERDGRSDHLYFLNTPLDKHAIQQVRSGQVDVGAVPRREAIPEIPEHRNIFGLYEENIGVLTPLIVEELKDAEKAYPHPWIVEAFRVAVEMDRRRWRYIQRVLEHWKAEGRPYGRPPRDTQETPAQPPADGGRPGRRGGYIVKRKPS